MWGCKAAARSMRWRRRNRSRLRERPKLRPPRYRAWRSRPHVGGSYRPSMPAGVLALASGTWHFPMLSAPFENYKKGGRVRTSRADDDRHDEAWGRSDIAILPRLRLAWPTAKRALWGPVLDHRSGTSGRGPRGLPCRAHETCVRVDRGGVDRTHTFCGRLLSRSTASAIATRSINVEHTMLVTLVGYDIIKGRALLMPTRASDLCPFDRRPPVSRHWLRARHPPRRRPCTAT